MGRFFANVKYPIHLVNNLLQGKFKAAGMKPAALWSIPRLGSAGLFDPAKHWKIEAHPADFDQTLGFYGLRPGIYFDWPVFGPSSPPGHRRFVGRRRVVSLDLRGRRRRSYGVPAYREVNGASLQPANTSLSRKPRSTPMLRCVPRTMRTAPKL